MHLELISPSHQILWDLFHVLYGLLLQWRLLLDPREGKRERGRGGRGGVNERIGGEGRGKERRG